MNTEQRTESEKDDMHLAHLAHLKALERKFGHGY